MSMFDDDYFLPPAIIHRLQQQLDQRSDGDFSHWMSDYLKRTTQVRGVPMMEIRHSVHRWHVAWELEQREIPHQLQLTVASQLFESDYVEDQVASVVYLDEILIPSGIVNPSFLHVFAGHFDRGLITNFKVCDYISTKLFQPLINRNRTETVPILRTWFHAPNTWLARSALGAFINLAADNIYEEVILEGCRTLVTREHPQTKSSVGSALRALGKRDPQLVENFFAVERHLACIHSAGLTKAISCLPRSRARELRARRKALIQRGVHLEVTAQPTSPSIQPSQSDPGSSSIAPHPVAPLYHPQDTEHPSIEQPTMEQSATEQASLTQQQHTTNSDSDEQRDDGDVYEKQDAEMSDSDDEDTSQQWLLGHEGLDQGSQSGA